MNKYSKIFVFLIIVCFITCISAVSASEISDDAIVTVDDYQSNIKINQENGLESISNDYNAEEKISNDYSMEENISDDYSTEENLKSKDTSVLSQDDGSGTFTEFRDDLTASGKEFNLTCNYAYDQSDSIGSASFYIENLTINGNNHVLDGSGSKFQFKFSPEWGVPSQQINLVINDLTIKNFKDNPLFLGVRHITLNNVNITDCISDSNPLVKSEGTLNLTLNNCNLSSNAVKGFFYLTGSKLTINNSYFSGKGIFNSALVSDRGQLVVENSIFENFNAYHGAVINYKGDYFSIRNSKFINTCADATGGAIIAKFFPLVKMVDDEEIRYYASDSLIENCIFYNSSSSSNGGAIHLDMDSGSPRLRPTLIVTNSNFTDCSSKFGGAISVLGGFVNISASNFTSNSAGFEGGAIYSSWSNINVTGSSFANNNANKTAGAIYFDKGSLLIDNSIFNNNKAFKESNNTANAIYAHDVDAIFSNSYFDNGDVGVYLDFADNSQLINVTKNNDAFLLDNHDYIVSIETPGIKLNLTGNQIVVDTLPSRFDARDWGWTTPGKVQGDNDDCWAFATVASLDTALLKSTGVAYNLSQNYVQKLQLKYFKAGDLRNSLTGFPYSGLGYALNWIGVLPMDGIYDDRGMISDSDLDDERIHVQDAMIIYTGQNDTVEQLKRAIIKYGAVTVQLYVSQDDDEIEFEGEDIAIMDHGTHFVSLIGWDDNFKDDPSDEESDPHFVWFTKDSLFGFSESESSDFSQIDYYAIEPQRAAVAYIFENTENYHVNYQTDLTGLAGFDANYTIYSNEFTSKYDELMAAVGTYFNESGIEYSFDVFLNGENLFTQTGLSEFAGFRTIPLDKYVPLKKGDQFKVVFKSNSVPYQAWSRSHYMNGTSLVSQNGNDWVDFAELNKTVCLKVYTIKGDDDSFTTLRDDIKQSGDEINLTHDYTFKKDYDDYILYDEDSNWVQLGLENEVLVINGNNHVINGSGAGAVLLFLNEEGKIVINDLTFSNFSTAVISSSAGITLNNVNFTDCKLTSEDIVTVETVNATLNGCNFYGNHANRYISEHESSLVINNSRFVGNDFVLKGFDGYRGNLIVHNSIFENFTCMNNTIIDLRGDRLELVNSSFINSKTQLSGGAILAKYFPVGYDEDNCTPSGPIIIKDCRFENLTAGNDGGAIHIDLDSASHHIKKVMNVINTNFTDCSSRFGGAISVMGGNLSISDSNFVNNDASFEGGALYSSWSNVNITGSQFINNTGGKNAGALYFDKGNLYISASDFINNKVLKTSNRTANAIYAHDVVASLKNSSFDNGGVAVYADFGDNSEIINVTKNDDIFLMDNHDYIVSIETPGIKLKLIENETVFDTLPSKFDARDYGWTTPGKVQGANDDCWAFATIASIETALKKSTGVEYNLSQNYVQELEMKYFWGGDLRISFTGFTYSGLGYALSWLGVMPMDSPYDDRGLILDTDLDDERIHVQDAMIIYTGQNDTVENLKRAIMKYGAVTVQIGVHGDPDEITTEGDDIAVMDHGTHFISLIGWDDNHYNEMLNQSYFAWFTKDSLFGFSTSDILNFPDPDIYAIAPQRAGVAYIFENTNDYHVNYQTDLTGLTGFDANYTIYSNEFTAKYSELIGAVGTYFNESGINYSFDILVNNKTVHTQSGVSEFAGFRTIVLDKYVPVKTGDVFKVVFKSNSVPYQAWSRVHYLNGTSLASADGNDWVDFATLNKTVCLKVYTVADDAKIVNNKDITVDYDGGSYFTVKVVTADGKAVGAGASVKFTINGKTTTVQTDNDGIARIKISEVPGKYTVTSSYNGVSYKNTVTVKQVLTVSKVRVKNTDSKLVLKATLKINGKLVSGKTLKFTFRGKTYSAKTNSKGVASVTIKPAVLKTLTGYSYAVKVTYLKDSVKRIVTVKQVIKPYAVTVKKSSKSFNLNALLKINGKVAKNKVIKFTFRGKTYSAKTSAKGFARVTIKSSVIKNLKIGQTYTVKIAYGKDYITTTVKVKK